MSQVSAKLRSTSHGFAHWCPGCEEGHGIAVHRPLSNGAKWTFDGNLDRPTFSPSVLVKVGPYWDDGRVEVCHYFLTAGQIQFLGDCTHPLAGQTVPLPDLPPHLRDNT